jgi:SAM-dependent methyltransferase
MFWIYFVNELRPRLPQGLKQLLHIAPEEPIARLLHEREDINYLSGDLTVANVMVKLDLQAMEFPDKRFDLIICSHVLEHVPDDGKAMAELFRVTRPGGYTLVMVPVHGKKTSEDPGIVDPKERLLRFGQADHVRKYGTDIQERLSGAGFKVTVRRPVANMNPDIAAYLGVLKGQMLFECYRTAG